MAGVVHPRFGRIRFGHVLLTLGILGAQAAWGATHYPPGAICYDCHAVSKSKMVVGTHLLKKSDRTVALGISASNPNAPCLFCHDKNAVPSAVGRDRMKGVRGHFDATSTSKHRADIQSGFGDHVSIFDCRDCHTGIEAGVASDGGGNATVHGMDASGGTRLNVPGTLIGWQAGGYDMSSHTCQNAACHGGGPSAHGAYTARPAHGMARTTINGANVPTGCNACHGTHNSYQNTSLITLRTDGTTSNNPGDPLATRVAPEKCGVCHVQDDAGVYAAKGHGQSTISSGTIGCTGCHTGTVPHSFSKDAPGTNSLRFKYAENGSVLSAIRPKEPYNRAYSICLTCHAPYAGKVHGGTTAGAGCNDCHEPHGAGVAPNVKMVRIQIPKVDPAGNPVYGDGSASAPYDTNSYLMAGDATYKAMDDTGLCDNRECHQGRVANDDPARPLWPLSTFLADDRHSGGDIDTGSDFACQTCHTHLDDKGSWGAAASCTTCHGQPPVSGGTTSEGYTRFSEAVSPHRRHASPVNQEGYGYGCKLCHQGYTSSATHNTTPKTYQSVAFGGTLGGITLSGSYHEPSTTCENVYCHSDGQTTASVGSVVWMTDRTAPNWSTQNLACNACHGGVEGPTRIATVSHTKHLASGAICTHCHDETVTTVGTDATTAIANVGAHVNGVKNLKSGGTYFGRAVTFAVGGAQTCTNISCHNNGNANWGAALACSDCHFRTAAQGGDIDNFVYGDGILAAVNSDEWGGPNTGNGHGRSGTSYPSGNPAANFSGPASDLLGCAYCHSFLDTANNPLVTHGVETNPFRLANRGTVSGTGNEHGGWNDACLVCHKTGQSGYDPDGVGGVYSSRNGTRNVDENHYGTKHAAGRNGGAFCWDCHDPHGDTQHYMIHSGDGSAPGRGVTDRSDGAYGIPVTSRPVTGLNVTSGGYTSEDLVNAGNTGLCQTCHATQGTPGGAASYNRNTFTPLADHNGANNQRCTACHTHDNDFGAGCTSCHGYPPPESPFAGTTVSWTSDKAAVPATLGLHETHAAGPTPYVNSACFLTCHTDTTHLTNKATADMGVKAATAGASTGIYKYATLDNYDVWTAGALPGNQSVVDDTCTNVACHASTYGTPANQYRSAANPTYTRYWNQNLNCYACHAYDGVAAASPRPTADAIATGSHGAHVGTYALACTNCHPSGAYTNAHKSGLVNFVANFGASRVTSATGGFYDLDGIAPFSTVGNLAPRENGGTGYFCASVYCHSGGEPRGPETIAYRNDTRWTVASTGDCGTCHAVDGVAGSAGLTTNVHETHVGSAAGQYGYACTVCHVTVVGGTKPAYTIASTVLHVDGVNNVAFAANEGTYSQAVGGTVTPAGGTCSATYCHSQGLDWSAPYNGTATAPVTTADWDTAQGTAGCGYCHGNPPAYANNTTIRPAATDLTKKNSHAAHASYTCDRCHYTTTQNGSAIATPANHANKAWEVAANTGAGVTFTVATQGTLSDTVCTPTTCNAISCHGGGNAQWGTTLTCADCHFRSAAQGGDRDNFVYGDDIVALVSSDEWAASGHGRPSGAGAYPSGNPAANQAGRFSGCTNYCHTTAVSHGEPANPFRLRTSGGLVDFSDTGYPQDDNLVCLDCHSAAGALSSQATTHVEKSHYGGKHAAGRNGGAFCWDCHDPHGDDQHYMVQGGAGVTARSDGVYGIPVTRRAVTGLDVTSGGYTSADLVNANKTGFCQTCHASTGGAQFYNQDLFTPLADHNGADTLRCTLCHPHSAGFGASCSGCHGSSATGQFWPSGTGGQPAWANNEPGAHDAHVRAIGLYLGYGNFAASMYSAAQQTAICAFCHPDPGGSGHAVDDGDQRVDLYGGTGPGDRFLAWRPGAGVFGEDASPAATYNRAGRTCANSGCHYRTTTPAYGGAGWNGAGQGANQATCLTCHFYRDGGTYASPPWTAGALPDAHPVHVRGVAPPSNAQSKTYPCATCHPVAGYTNAHADGSIGLGTSGLPNPTGAESFGSFTAQLKYGAGAAATQCTNFYCHGAAFPADMRGTNTAPVWNDHTTAYCSTCHNVDVNGGLGNAVTRGKHTTHLSPFGTGPRWGPGMGSHSADCTFCHGIRSHSGGTPGCFAQLCHPGGGNDRPGGITDRNWASFPTASHVDGQFRVDFQGRDRGWNWFDDYAGGSTAGTVTNLAGTDVCDRCHSTAEVAGARGAQLAKDNWLTPGYRLPCASCHNATSPAYSTAVNAGIAAREKTSRYTADNGGHGRAGTFSATGNPAPGYTQCTECHNATSLHITGFAGDGTRLAGGLTRLNICGDCHVPGRTTLGVLGRDATVEASFHASSVTGNYGTNAAYNYACVVCHDPHGTANIAMIKATIADGMGAQATGVALFAETGLDPSSAPDNGVCDRCHADGAQAHALTSFPNNHNYGTRCLDCHDHKRSFSSSCEGCHGGGDPAAPRVVWPGADRPGGSGQAAYGSHLKALRTQTLSGTTNWKAQCNQCHTGHAGPVAVPLPPASWNDPSGRLSGTDMQVRLGIRYTSTGGIHLGGTATSGTSEAEICWNCHDAQSPRVSEWGYNTKTTPAGFPVFQYNTADGQRQSYHYGWLWSGSSFTTQVSDWTLSPWWKDEYDPLVTRRIVSVHSASFDPAHQSSSVAANVDASGAVRQSSAVLEPREGLRCSYCHAVHDTFGPSGKPHLRGTWMGNPYPPDKVPRASPGGGKDRAPPLRFRSNDSPGNAADRPYGYYIDRNSGWPANGRTLAETSGLCVLCHGSNVDTMDFYTGSSLWLPGTQNGHSNSTLGGTGVRKADLFDARRPELPDYTMGWQDIIGAPMPLGTGAKIPPVTNSGWYGGTPGSLTRGPDYNLWYAAGAVPTLPHTFTCSKCHTPHASGLPALLITNCVDTGYPSSPAYGDMRSSYATNCHRKTAVNDGWHRLQPGQ